jgi:hypothetical protein
MLARLVTLAALLALLAYGPLALALLALALAATWHYALTVARA